MLEPIQKGLCRLYRIEPEVEGVDVRDFVIDDLARRRMGVARAPREQLVVVQRAAREGDTEGGADAGEEEVSIGLFVDEEALRRLETVPRAERVRDALAELCLAIEGVSHFVYLVHRARQNRPVSAVELELQAEIDKYVTCVLETWADGGPPDDLRPRLFARFDLDPNLSDEERERYLLAAREAASYARSLEQRFIRARALPDMLAELRRVFRLGFQEKLDAMRRAA